MNQPAMPPRGGETHSSRDSTLQAGRQPTRPQPDPHCAHPGPATTSDPQASDLDAVRRARATLALLFEPDDTRLRDLLVTRSPVEAASDLLDRLDGHPPAELRSALGEPATRLREIAAGAVAGAARHGSRILIPEDPDWPAGVADLATPPPPGRSDRPAALCLWVRGDQPLAALHERAIAITGSRAATGYGLHVATELAFGLSEHGRPVVTTGGYGIDGAAHRGALAAEAASIAVLPCGLDRPHPAGNRSLFERIAAHGALASMYPPGANPRRGRILATRRLIAALASATVLVEASRRSTALITLRAALALGRPAMVVPGPVTCAASGGIHQALRDNPAVRLVTSADDVLTDLTGRIEAPARQPVTRRAPCGSGKEEP